MSPISAAPAVGPIAPTADDASFLRFGANQTAIATVVYDRV